MQAASEAKESARGRTTASRKRQEEILLAAKAVFFESGFQLASMDKIAAAAGTTKRTVYDYFGSKEALFSAVIALGCEMFVNALPRPSDLPRSVGTGLRIFAGRVQELVSTADGIRFQRLVIAEAERHPEFGNVLYQTAFVGAERLLAEYLDGQISSGLVKTHDVRVSARIVMDLATNSIRLRGLLAPYDVNSDDLATKALDQIILLFEQAYSVSTKKSRSRS